MSRLKLLSFLTGRIQLSSQESFSQALLVAFTVSSMAGSKNSFPVKSVKLLQSFTAVLETLRRKK